jgi:S1-C subfamily serine protease
LGTKPGVVSLDTLDFTAKVLAIDPWQHQVTLQTADGRTKPVRVGEYVNLADFNVGDEVVVRLTQALAILVEKP